MRYRAHLADQIEMASIHAEGGAVDGCVLALRAALALAEQWQYEHHQRLRADVDRKARGGR